MTEDGLVRTFFWSCKAVAMKRYCKWIRSAFLEDSRQDSVDPWEGNAQ